MEFIDNINRNIRDDLASIIQKGDRISIAAACFSIYAFQELKEQLLQIEELRFIFTSPTFVKEKAANERREFYIPRLDRERALYGTEFEVRLRNELSQKAIARECADWIHEKVKFRSITSNGVINPFLNVEQAKDGYSYAPINGFTTAGLGCERGNNIAIPTTKFQHSESDGLFSSFNSLWNDDTILQDVTEQVIEHIAAVYAENSPQFIYYIALYNIFREFLADINEDVLPNEAVGFKKTAIWEKLYNFQQEAALGIINKLERFNGCILADSVGLGKTFTALAVIKYYELRNRNVLVLCPKKLADNWLTFRENYLNNPIATDRLNYDVLFHTDLSRHSGTSFTGQDLSKLNWSNYDLIVIDESHNFRNGGDYSGAGEERRENRYLTLLNKVIRQGVKSKILMLSATPVNNRFSDLRHQLELAYEGDPSQIDAKLGISKSINDIFRQAQQAFNQWADRPANERTTENLLQALSFDFFTVLDSVTIARSRKHIEKYYDTSEIGRFPDRLAPISLRPRLTSLPRAVDYDEIFAQLYELSLAVYIPTAYLQESRRDKYVDPGSNIDRAGREKGLRRLMAINLLKRLESSVYSFRITLDRVKQLIDSTINQIAEFEKHKSNGSLISATDVTESDLDGDDANSSILEGGGRRIDIDLHDMDYTTWRRDLEQDSENLALLIEMVQDITPQYDTKLQTLAKLIADKQECPVNPNNRKVLLFTAFADTADYLYRELATSLHKQFGIHTALVTGSTEGRTTLKLENVNMNTVLTLFSPISKDKALLMPDFNEEIDLLIATDCISEGQNLQDCDYCINYDIHWNPVRIIQRFGRIDRIGSRNRQIQLVNFWPNLDLDKYLELKGRVETRMKASILAGTGDDNPIDPAERGDLEYRRKQLEQLQERVVDVEEMGSGISIMDLGLNEFRLDLIEYTATHGDLDHTPFGLHAVAPASADNPPGTIFILKNRSSGINPRNHNQLHPFYLVYMRHDGLVHLDHLQPKKLLDSLRSLCRERGSPIPHLFQPFNKATKDGRDMRSQSALLTKAVGSIIELNTASDVDSLFREGGTSALSSQVRGLEDFELICFVVVE